MPPHGADTVADTDAASYAAAAVAAAAADVAAHAELFTKKRTMCYIRIAR